MDPRYRPTSRRRAAAAVLLALALAPCSVPAQQRYWYDGQTRRLLWVDAARTADFSGDSGARASVVQPSQVVKSTAPASPVFSDSADLGGTPRALPGGVIVELKPGTDDAGRRVLFARHGVEPVRQVDGSGRVWLVATPPGLPSLDAANRLYESGDFAAAAPNWWRPRTRK